VISIPEKISPKQIALIQNKYLRDKFVDEHHIDHYVHIPTSVKEAVSACATQYPELKSSANLSVFTDDTQQIITQEQALTITQQLIALLNESPLKNNNPIDTTIKALEQYLRDIESGKLHVASDSLMEDIALSQSGTRASQNLYNTNTGLAIAGGGILNISGVSNIGTQGSGNTVTVSLNSNLSLSGPLVITNGGIYSTGPTILSSLSGPGVLTANSTGVLSTSATTNNSVQIGNVTGTLTSIPVGSNGQALIGANNAKPLFATLTSNSGTIAFTPGASSLNLEANTSSLTGFTTQYPTDAGTASPSGGALTIHGGSNINTSTGTNSATVNVNLNSSISVTGSITAGSGLVVQSGGINATGPIGFNSLTGPGAVTVSSTGLLNSARATANGQLLLGVSGGLPFFTGLSSAVNPSGAASIIYSSGANFLSIQSVPLFGNVIRVDWLNGNDATATVTNGFPYKTITGAMNAISTSAIASSVNPVVVWVMPGIYNETVTMQKYVSLIGMTQGAGAEAAPTAGVIIQQLNVTSTTTLITMADYSRLENVSLNLTTTTSNQINLTGISFPSTNTSSATARVQSVTLTINRASTFANGGENTYGIFSQSTGIPLLEVPVVRDCTIYVINNASVKSNTGYGIYLNPASNTQGLTVQDCNINLASPSKTQSPFACLAVVTGTCYVSDSTITGSVTSGAGGTIYGLYVQTSGASCAANNCYISVSTNQANDQAYGVWLNTSGTTCTVNNSSISGINTVTPANGGVIVSLGGSMTFNNTVLLQGNNTISLATTASQTQTSPSSFVSWSTNGTASVSTGTTLIMLLGGGGANAQNYTGSYYTAKRPMFLKNLRVATTGTVGGTGNAVFTLYTGTPTGTASALTATITNGASTGSDTTHSVPIQAGTAFYVLLSGSSASSATVPNPVVTIEMY